MDLIQCGIHCGAPSIILFYPLAFIATFSDYSRIGPAVELVAAKRPALVPIADRVGGKPLLSGKRGSGIVLRAAGRTIAVAKRGLVVPPTALVAGRAEEDFITQILVFEPDPDQLHQVLRAQPDRQPPAVGRRIGEIADTQTSHAQAVLIGVKRADGFTERLAHAVARIRTHRLARADAAAPRIEADGVVRRGENDALDLVAPRRLEQIVAADNIGVEDAVPGLLDGFAAEVNDAVDAIDNFFHLREVGEI